MADEESTPTAPEPRPLKPAELNQPSEHHARIQEEVKATLQADHQAAAAQHKSMAAEGLTLEQQKADIDAQVKAKEEHAAKQAERTAWVNRIDNGSVTEPEMMELKMHPHHTNIGSGHGNPA